MRRPRLGSISTGIFVLSLALHAGLSASVLLYLLGTMLFVRDAACRRELGPFNPGLLLRGPRVLLLVGVLLASCAFSASWDPTFHFTLTRIQDDVR